tara:strand:+ start:1179 stop:1409 length:231 start_codon:yes stop_codon:yes gene_type:complete
METEIKNSAHDKAFANIMSCNNDISRLKQELKTGTLSPFITIEQHQGVLDRAKKELKIWNYIAKLIETDNGFTKYF